MIFLNCAAVDFSLEIDALAEIVKSELPNPQNSDYLNEILNRKNANCVKESMSALVLLIRTLDSLPLPIDKKNLTLARNENGKPYFVGSDVKFSLTHSKGLIACAVAVCDEVGVDIESAEPTCEKAVKLAERFFFEEDRKRVKECPQNFARIWSEKEATAKYLGIGLSEYLKNEKSQIKTNNRSDYTLHRFSFLNTPITLCAKDSEKCVLFSVLK